MHSSLRLRVPLVFSIYVLALMISSLSRAAPRYLDERIYIRAGELYVREKICPLEFNGEHPPLAKYILGFTGLLADPRIASMLASLLILLILMVFLDEAGFLAALLLALDPVFINVSKSGMLEPIGGLFLTAAFILGLRLIQRSRGNSYVSWALFILAIWLALLSKYLFLYGVAPLAAYILYRQYKSRGTPGTVMLFFTFIAAGLMLFAVMYSVCIYKYGLRWTVSHLWETRNLYVKIHEPSPRITAIGFLHEFFRVEIWKAYNTTFYLNTTTWTLSTGNITRIGYMVMFDGGEFAPHVLAWFPLLVYFPLRVTRGREGERMLDMPSGYLYMVTLGSALVFIHEPLAWYYYASTILFSIMLGSICRGGRTLCYALMLADASYLALYYVFVSRASLSVVLG